jgi:hypothetical protein
MSNFARTPIVERPARGQPRDAGHAPTWNGTSSGSGTARSGCTAMYPAAVPNGRFYWPFHIQTCCPARPKPNAI